METGTLRHALAAADRAFSASAVGEVFHAGQRVRLRLDTLGRRAGETGRVARVESRRQAGGRVALSCCAMDADAGRRLAPFSPTRSSRWRGPAPAGTRPQQGRPRRSTASGTGGPRSA